MGPSSNKRDNKQKGPNGEGSSTKHRKDQTKNGSRTAASGVVTSADGKSLTQQAVVKYIQQATAQAAAAAAAAAASSSTKPSTTSNASGSTSKEGKITFGPPRPPPSNSRGNGNNTAASAAAADSYAAAAAVAAAAAISFGSWHAVDESSSNETTKGASGSKATTTSTSTVDGLPCSEAEMKALMNMFVDIMGMNVDADGNPIITQQQQQQHQQGSKNAKNGMANSMFMFGSAAAASANVSNGGSLPPGWPDHETLAAATAELFADGGFSWEAMKRTYARSRMGGFEGHDDYDDDDDDAENDPEYDYDDDNDDDDEDNGHSIPNLDTMRQFFAKTMPNSTQIDFTPHSSNKNQINNRSTGSSQSTAASATINPAEWASLEQVAKEDAMEIQERARKAAKKREKKQRRKQKLREEAATKAAEAAQKKREKTALSWRSRVLSACQANELSKLEGLLEESPFTNTLPTSTATTTTKNSTTTSNNSTTDNLTEETYWTRTDMLPHLEFLLPNVIAKHRTELESGFEIRRALATHILTLDLQLAFLTMKNGRSAFHCACFYGDLRFVRLTLNLYQRSRNRHSMDQQESSSNSDQGSNGNDDAFLIGDCLNATCSDLGWTPLHYAAASGYTDIVEVLLRAGCSPRAVTNDTLTWRARSGVGLTPRELVQLISEGTCDAELKTKGTGWQDMQHMSLSNRDEHENFLRTLEKLKHKLEDAETNGYAPPSRTSSYSNFSEEAAGSNSAVDSVTNKKRKKKKKKKQVSQEETDDDLEDPLVAALLGMGFSKDRITAAVKACGGTSRATADDLVTWILGQDADNNNTADDGIPSEESAQHENGSTANMTHSNVKEASEMTNDEEEARQKEEAARQRAAKREEQRRRNREWNNREQARQQQEARAKIVSAFGPSVVVPSAIPLSKTEGLPAPQSVGTLNGGLSTAPPLGVTLGSAPTKFTTQEEAIPIAQTPNVHDNHDFPQLTQPTVGAVPDILPGLRLSAPSISLPIHPRHSFPPSADDDRTVSSFGSNRGVSVSSVPIAPLGGPFQQSIPSVSSIPPPGFSQPLPGITPQGSVEEFDEHAVEPNATFEFRATAKAFVPQSFTPSAPELKDSMSSLPSFTGPTSRVLSSAPLSAVNSSIDRDTAVPSPFLGGAVESSLLGFNMPSTYDRVPSLGTSGDTSTAPSIGSSLAGGVPLSDDTPLPIPPLDFGVNMESGVGSTTSLLSSAFTSGVAVGNSSIWGGPSTNGAHSIIGLPPVSFGDPAKATNEHGKDSSNEKATMSSWTSSGSSIW